MNKNCVICGAPISNSWVGTGHGYAHSGCYTRQHPPIPATTIEQVARGIGDPVIAAEVVSQLVPEELAAKIVAEYNRRMLTLWQKRCEIDVN